MKDLHFIFFTDFFLHVITFVSHTQDRDLLTATKFAPQIFVAVHALPTEMATKFAPQIFVAVHALPTEKQQGVMPLLTLQLVLYNFLPYPKLSLARII